MAASPTQLTLRHLRGLGYAAEVTERWNPYARVRQDLFGFADVLALRGDTPGVWGIQATTAENVSHRLAKIRALPVAREWLLARNRLAIWGWRKKKGRWGVVTREVTLEDYDG